MDLLVGEGTVFDLPDSRLRQTELSFAAGSYRYLRVTWDDARSARVAQAPSVAAREIVNRLGARAVDDACRLRAAAE